MVILRGRGTLIALLIYGVRVERDIHGYMNVNHFAVVPMLAVCCLLSGFGISAQAPAGSPRPEVGADAGSIKETKDIRQLQSDEFLVDTAYLQDEDEFLHKLTYQRGNDGEWSADFTEEVTLGSQKHQFVLSIPAHIAGNDIDISKGVGDAHLEYSFGLYGDSSSRVTVSPGVGLSIPTGSVRKGLGAGGPGLSLKIPVGVLLGGRFASNSIFEMEYTRSARNIEGEHANSINYQVGQSFVWFAKPRLNLFIESVWERSKEIIGVGRTRNQYSLLVSPAVRWAYELKSGLSISPGIAVPIGIGPSRGTRDIVFYIAFGHPARRGQD